MAKNEKFPTQMEFLKSFGLKMKFPLKSPIKNTKFSNFFFFKYI